MIIGINVFGFGGNVQADRETGPWKQTMNGETKQIPNPLERCQEQKKQLEGILASAGLSDIPVTVLPVFTSKTVVLTGYLKGRCCRSDDLKDILTREEYSGDGPVAVKETEAAGDDAAEGQEALRTSLRRHFPAGYPCFWLFSPEGDKV